MPLDVGRGLTSAQSHSSIVDQSGMAVSITSSVNFVWGSQVMDPVSGILLNNEVCPSRVKDAPFSQRSR